jgi:site-specific recombinase XerD
LQRLAAAAGLPPIRLHDLRHTAAGLALQAGVPLKVVPQELGHGSVGISTDMSTSVLPAVAAAEVACHRPARGIGSDPATGENCLAVTARTPPCNAVNSP